jgi:hypothetical protein
MGAIVCGGLGVVLGAAITVSVLAYGPPHPSIAGVGQLAATFLGICLCVLGWTLLRRPQVLSRG